MDHGCGCNIMHDMRHTITYFFQLPICLHQQLATPKNGNYFTKLLDYRSATDQARFIKIIPMFV